MHTLTLHQVDQKPPCRWTVGLLYCTVLHCCTVLYCTVLYCRWTVGLLVSLFLVHALAARLQHTAAPWWKFFLYLTSWARLLAATHYLAEAALVTRRWRAESRASNEGLCRYHNHREGPH